MTTNQSTTDNPHYVTAEEAQEVGCVMSMGRQNPSIVYQTCLGPKCMAWRWVNLIKEVKDIDDCVIREGIFSTTHGYCGMVHHD
jgi:hypothetical protein